MTDQIEVDDLAEWARRSHVEPARLIVGIWGPPGSGKSTIASRVATEIDAAVVPMDGFHLPNAVLDARGWRAVKGAPHTFDADAFVDAIRLLRADEADVSLPSFDRVIDEPVAEAVAIRRSARRLVVEGNYLLLDDPPWAELSDLFDATAYIDLDDDVRVGRLVARHIEFGKSPDEAREFVERSDERNAGLVAASRGRTDVVVRAA